MTKRLSNQIYVENSITGSNSSEGIICLCEITKEMFGEASFKMPACASNIHVQLLGLSGARTGIKIIYKGS